MIDQKDATQVSPESKPFLDRAVKILYEENFDKLFAMFEQNGPERFPQAMSAAINSVLERIKGEGEIPEQSEAEVAIAIFTMLLEDINEAGIMQITGDMVQSALQAFVKDYVMKNPGSFDQAAFDQNNQGIMAAAEAEGQSQDPRMQQAQPQGGGLLNRG